MSEPWFSPRAQDAVYAAQQARLTDPTSAGPTSPPLSAPSVSGSGRLTAMNASLKLITSFGAKGAPLAVQDDPTPLAVGMTPILDSAVSPRGGGFGRFRGGENAVREQSEARTATPGGFARKKRLPSKSDIARAKLDAAEMATPLTASRETGSRTHSRTGSRQRGTSSVSSVPEPTTALKPTVFDPERPSSGNEEEAPLPPPSHGAFRKRKEGSQKRGSREKKPEGLVVDILETRYNNTAYSPAPTTNETMSTTYSIDRSEARAGALDPPLTGASMKSARNMAIDNYISSVEEARVAKRQERAGSRARAESRSRGQGRTRTDSRTSRASSRGEPRSDNFIKPAQRSPSSPIPMSPEEIAQASTREAEAASAEDFYKIASPIEFKLSDPFETLTDRRWSGDDAERASARQRSPDHNNLSVNDDRGRGDARGPGSTARSPSSPLPLVPDEMRRQDDDTQSDGRRVFLRSQSNNRRAGDLQSRRAASRTRSERSTSRRPKARAQTPGLPASKFERLAGSDSDEMAEPQRRPRTLTKKQLAAKELEDRRLSLARRPSAPPIPSPGDLTFGRPGMTPRSHTELGNSPHSHMPPLSRSATVDPEAMMRYGKTTGTSTTSAPIGLPATPRAMRHPRYMSADPDRDAPPVPELPDTLSSLSGSNLSQLTGSAVSQMASSSLSQAAPSSLSQVSSALSNPPKEAAESDDIGPLLPSTVFGMKGPQGPARSASAPPEKLMGRQVHPAYNANLPTSTRRLSGGRGHVRKISPPSLANIEKPEISSIDQALYSNMDQDIVVVPEEEQQGPPILLPQLQHLAGPPPPPPPPTMFQQPQSNHSDVIDVTIGNDDAQTMEAPDLSETPTSFPQTFPQPMSRAQTVSPSMSRHRRGSASTSDTFGSRMRGVADKMRSSSRSRTNKQLPTLEPYTFKSPYETVLPPVPSQHGHSRKNSINRAKSPYEQAMAEQSMQMPPPPPPPPAPPAAGEEYKFSETTVPPRSQSAMAGYRNPKEIRANMPPAHLQPGVYTPLQGGFL